MSRVPSWLDRLFRNKCSVLTKIAIKDKNRCKDRLHMHRRPAIHMCVMPYQQRGCHIHVQVRLPAAKAIFALVVL